MAEDFSTIDFPYSWDQVKMAFEERENCPDVQQGMEKKRITIKHLHSHAQDKNHLSVERLISILVPVCYWGRLFGYENEQMDFHQLIEYNLPAQTIRVHIQNIMYKDWLTYEETETYSGISTSLTRYDRRIYVRYNLPRMFPSTWLATQTIPQVKSTLCIEAVRKFCARNFPTKT